MEKAMTELKRTPEEVNGMTEEQLRAALRKIKCFMLDMDGTFYLGNQILEGSLDFLDAVEATGRTVLFLTNNSSRSADYYVEKLKRMNVREPFLNVLTSGQATARYCKANFAGKKAFLLGNHILAGEFEKMGVPVDNENPDYVVIAFDTELDYAKMTAVCDFVRAGLPYIATHPDYNCPTETGFIPDSGAIAAFVTASTGKKPVYFGKPYRETVEMIGEATGTPLDRMCIFGDRLYTDIAVGKRHGITAVLVYSGETTPEDVEAADPKERPDYAYPSLDDVDRIMFGKKVCRRGKSPAGRSEKA
jgi:Predicted sugar phosphatases of the HAD superfamily